ncbi:hypothetical protein QR680_014664 [Steinernema hermaphroditum]|uniref:F-box domain-containing protein n=1 Tax=Steinernema hermaphroditum TaxID=289476 RepID=A0AA39IB64_9BILA|nr:hypothetical protein QR680_014664 [Steinernema hermaphroditum]
MEGVPYDFIDRVLNRLDSEVLYEIYTSIDDPSWKEIAIKYEKKRKYYRLHLYPSLEGPWSYELLDEERNHYRFEEISREDSRFVVFYILSIRQRSGLETSCELDRALVSDLIHLVAECTLKRTIAYLEVDLNQEFHDVQNQFMAEILQADLNVEILSITSFTPHSEAFVVKQMRLETMNDLVLGDWTRGSSWTENLKEPLGDFLFSSRNHLSLAMAQAPTRLVRNAISFAQFNPFKPNIRGLSSEVWTVQTKMALHCRHHHIFESRLFLWLNI